MKIVLVINDLKGNGAERVVITLAREFKRMGHEVTVVCFKDTIEFDVVGLDIAIFPIKFWRWIPRKIRGYALRFLLDRFITKKAKGAPDLVLSNLLPCDRIMSASRLQNVHIVLHNTLSQERGSPAKYPELRIYTKKPIVCVSEGVRMDYLALFPNRHGFAQTIYNPIEINSVKAFANTATDDLPDKPFIVHVGKFKKEKRHDLLIRAFAASKTKHDLVLLGQGHLMNEAQKLASELCVAHRVHFLGFKSNPYPYIKAASLLVLSSDFEGLGMVLLEALTLGTPAISTDCKSGPSEILPKTSLCPINDVSALSALLSEPDYTVFLAELQPRFKSEFAAKEYLKLVA